MSIKSRFLKFASIISLVGLSQGSVALEKVSYVGDFSIGDIITHEQGSKWHVVKLIEIDQWEDGSFVFHVLTYKAVNKKPTLQDVSKLEIISYHAPVDGGSYEGWLKISNSKPTKHEAIGYVEYLKQVDFQRYAEYTNQDIREIVSKANTLYKEANDKASAKNFKSAIELYSEAIDIFPLFFEAIDNRAFTYMDLGRYQQAYDDFTLSLSVNPNGKTAFFSRGECLLRLEKYEEAKAIFSDGIKRFPDDSELFRQFYSKAEQLSNRG